MGELEFLIAQTSSIIISFSVTMMTDIVMKYPEGTKIQLLAPIVHAEKGTKRSIRKN